MTLQRVVRSPSALVGAAGLYPLTIIRRKRDASKPMMLVCATCNLQALLRSRNPSVVTSRAARSIRSLPAGASRRKLLVRYDAHGFLPS